MQSKDRIIEEMADTLNENGSKLGPIQRSINSRIRGAFVFFLEECRTSLKADEIKIDVDDDLKAIGRLLNSEKRRINRPTEISNGIN